ncbi:MAG: alpha/beta fold hydrolase [Myxococcota bacterium]
MTSSSDWFHIPKPLVHPRMRLICLPYAGGSGAVFHHWPAGLPADIEVCAAQLPGRTFRLREEPIRSFERLLAELGRVVEPLCDGPFALLGHSLGALTAFELTRWLRARGRNLPVHLFVLGHSAPQANKPRPALHALPTAELTAELTRRYGTSALLATDPALQELVLPALRADLEVLTTWRHESQDPLSIPITAMFGKDDQSAPPASGEAWRHETRAEFLLHELPGSHYFIDTSRPTVLELVSRALSMAEST